MPDDFDVVFEQLRTLLKPYEDDGVVKEDADDNYTLLAPDPDPKGRDVWIGSVQIKKNYVSFHLMPVYIYPQLLEDTSAELRARMQGKSCFNFRGSDPALFDELAALTDRGFRRYEADGLVDRGDG